MSQYPTLTDMVPRREPRFNWERVESYAVYNRDGKLIISPWSDGFKHAEASAQFDLKLQWDDGFGLNVADKYINRRRRWK